MPGLVHDQGGPGTGPILAVESMQHFLRPLAVARRQLIDSSDTVGPAGRSRAVQVPIFIENQPTNRILAIDAVQVEVVQDFPCPCTVLAGDQLKDNAAAPVTAGTRAPLLCSPVKVSSRVQNQAGVGTGPVLAV